ncbi:hypothetical protein JOQ06_002100 [Pogonophryne albipinna]|uniref:Uncharacterized protein n=1 Tax=Pogonophryne albipinna TaxID=1090488 RepID=A0AAD6B755_9TELE|nr:hypothetical protein JOQ06_002100 [Pogonophryne albipinna]
MAPRIRPGSVSEMETLECSKENVWSPFSWWGDPSCDSLSMSESKGPNGATVEDVVNRVQSGARTSRNPPVSHFVLPHRLSRPTEFHHQFFVFIFHRRSAAVLPSGGSIESVQAVPTDDSCQIRATMLKLEKNVFFRAFWHQTPCIGERGEEKTLAPC